MNKEDIKFLKHILYELKLIINRDMYTSTALSLLRLVKEVEIKLSEELKCDK